MMKAADPVTCLFVDIGGEFWPVADSIEMIFFAIKMNENT
jgi:hypothetical protein